MEKEQFTFTGLGWMTPENKQEMFKSLKVLEKYGIKHDFREGTNGCRLIISGFTDYIENRYCDEDVVFLCKYEHNTEELSEDYLVIFKADDNLKFEAKVLYPWGEIEELQ